MMRFMMNKCRVEVTKESMTSFVCSKVDARRREVLICLPIYVSFSSSDGSGSGFT